MKYKVYPKFYSPYERRQISEKKYSKYVDYNLPREELLPYMNNETDWIISEKIDGTNTRIIWDGYTLQVKGRTDASHLQGYQNELLDMLEGNGNYLFDETFGESEVIIYGETFGGKIQGNPHKTEPTFQVFDINIGGLWLRYEDIQEISDKLGLEMVPHSVIKGWDAVLNAFVNVYTIKNNAGEYFEGLVALPAHMPLTRTGERVITKIKVADFENLNN